MADGSKVGRPVLGGEIDAVVVGAGFGGMYMLYKLREAGFLRNVHTPAMFAARDMVKDLDLGLALLDGVEGVLAVRGNLCLRLDDDEVLHHPVIVERANAEPVRADIDRLGHPGQDG